MLVEEGGAAAARVRGLRLFVLSSALSLLLVPFSVRLLGLQQVFRLRMFLSGTLAWDLSRILGQGEGGFEARFGQLAKGREGREQVVGFPHGSCVLLRGQPRYI